MRTALALFTVGLCALTTGCRLAVHFARNVAYEPMRYTDDVVECYRNERLARAAWDHVVVGCRGRVYSKDYERGFKDGYADYLRYRGPGTPPPIPPKCYWNQHYQTPAGHAAIEDWYAGFMHGAGAARESWRAPFLTVPTHAEGPDPVRATAPTPSETAPTPVGEPLPLPMKDPPRKDPEAEPLKEPRDGKPGEDASRVPPSVVVPVQVEVAAPPTPSAFRRPESSSRGTPYSVVPQP